MKLTDKRTLLIETIKDLTFIANANDWCVTEDHCIARLVYDYTVLNDWRKVVNAPAYKNMTNNQLDRALSLCEKLKTCNKYYVDLLQYASLKWRDKL